MGKVCKTMATVCAICGTIGAFFVAGVLGKDIYGDFNWAVGILYFLVVEFAVAMTTVLLYTVGEIHEKVFSTPSIDVSSGLEALGKANEEEKIISNGGWKCPDCGKVNFSYNTTCKCGKSKSDI